MKKEIKEVKLGLARCCDIRCEDCPFELLNFDIIGHCWNIVCDSDCNLTLFQVLEEFNFNIKNKNHMLMHEMLNTCLNNKTVEIEVYTDEDN